MNEKLARIETLQRIQALQRSIRIKGNINNTAVSTLFTAVLYPIVIYYLFTSDDSFFAKWYQNYLQSNSVEAVKQHLQESVQPLASKMSAEMTLQFEKGFNFVDSVSDYYKKIEQDMDDFISLILDPYRSEFKKIGLAPSDEELWEMIEMRALPTEVSNMKMLLKTIFKNTLPKKIHDILPELYSQVDKSSLPKLFRRLKNLFQRLGSTTFKTQMDSDTAELISTKTIQQAKGEMIGLLKDELSKFSQYIQRARYAPELAGLFFTHFALIKPTLNRFFPQGIRTHSIEIPENEYITEQRALELISKLSSQQRSLTRRTENLTWYTKRIILPALILGYFISDVDSPLYWLITVNMFLISFSEWIYSDSFEKQQKLDQKKCEQNNTTLSNWLKSLKDFKIDTSYDLSEDPSSSCVILNFSQETANKQNNKMLSNLFQQLLAHHQVKIEYADSYKVVLLLAQPVTAFNALSQVSPQRLTQLLKREQQINLLLSQIKKLDEYLFLSVDYEIETSALMEKSYLIKIYLPSSLNEAVLKTLADKSWLNENQTLTFRMAGPIPDNVFSQWLDIFEAHSFAKLDPPSSSPISQHQEQKETPTKLSHRKIVQDLKASPKIEVPKTITPKQPIRWRSAIFDPSKPNNYVEPVENGFGRHYTLRLFSEKNCPKDVFSALKHIISDRVKFVGDTGQQGLKRTKLRIKNQAGEDVPATRKAKVKGFFGKVRAAAYEERAETGEVLHIFTAKNIYKGHS